MFRCEPKVCDFVNIDNDALIISLSVSAILGLPATIHPNHTILTVLARRPPSVPPTLYSLLQISFQRHKFSFVLGQSERTADGLAPEPFPLIRAHEMESELLEQRDIEHWNISLKIIYLGSRLHIYTYALMTFNIQHNGEDTNSRSDTAQVAEYLSRVQKAALDTIELRCSEEARRGVDGITPPSEAPRPADQPLHWTIFEFHSLLTAVCFLLKLTKFWKIDPDPITTGTAITSAWNIFNSMSRTKDDIFARICDIIRYITRVDWSSCKERGMIVRSRMGANMTYEVVVRARNRFNERRAQAQEDHHQYRGASANDDNQIEPNSGNRDVDNPLAALIGDDMLPLGFDFLWGDWEAADALFAGM